MQPITITLITEEGVSGFKVQQGDRYADNLCYDECLALVSELVHKAIEPRSLADMWMKTKEQHEQYDKWLKSRNKQNI